MHTYLYPCRTLIHSLHSSDLPHSSNVCFLAFAFTFLTILSPIFRMSHYKLKWKRKKEQAVAGWPTSWRWQLGKSPYPLAHLWMHRGRCKLLSVGRSSDQSALLGDKFLIPTLVHFILRSFRIFCCIFLFSIYIHNKLSQNNEMFQEIYL